MSVTDAAASDEPVAPAGSTMRGAGALFASRLIVAALGWTGTVLIARELQEEGFGAFTLVFSLLGMLSIITDLGLGRIALAGLLDPEADSARFAGTYVVLRTVLGFLGYGAVVGFVAIADYPDVVFEATVVAGLVPILATPAHAYEIAFQAHHRLAQTAVVRVIAQMGQLALTIALVVAGYSLVWLTVPAVLNAAIVLGLTAPLAHRLESFTYTVDRVIWGRLVREAVPLSVGTAMATLYYRVDSVMLSKLDDLSAVGVYGVAYKFVDIAHLVPSALSVAILAALVKAWPDDIDRLRVTVRRAAAVLAIVGGLLVIEVLLFAEPMIELLYGESYREGDAALRILLLGEWGGYVTSLGFAVLVATARHRRYPFITLIGLVLNVAINFVFIPRWSYEGAAAATLLTELVVAALMVAEVRRVPGLAPIGLTGLPKIAVPMVLALVIGAAADLVLPWIVAAGATAVAFLIAADRIRFTDSKGLVNLVRAW